MMIGIGGGSGSGKTALARALAGALPGEALVVETDWYYRDLSHLTAEERAGTNFDHPEALDWALFSEQLGGLRAGRAVERPLYDYRTHTRRAETMALEPTQYVLVEGLFALQYAAALELYDLAVFVDAPEALRLERRLARDVRARGRTRESVVEQFRSSVAPMHARYVEPGRERCGLLLDGAAPLKELVDAVLRSVKPK